MSHDVYPAFRFVCIPFGKRIEPVTVHVDRIQNLAYAVC